MADEIFDSIVFGFDWRNKNFVPFFAYLVALGFASLFVMTLFQSPYAAGTSLSALAFLVAAILLFLAVNFLIAAVQLLVIGMALKAKKIAVRKLKPIDYLKFFVLDILALIAALFSIFNPRGLALLGATLFLAIIAYSTSSFVLGAIAFVLFFAYLVVFVYNAFRLSQSPFFFATKNNSIFGSFKNSLDATEGHVLWLAALFTVVFLVALGSVMLVTYLLAMWASLIFNGQPDGFAGVVIKTLLSPILTFTSLFASAAIYCLLAKRKRTKYGWMF